MVKLESVLSKMFYPKRGARKPFGSLEDERVALTEEIEAIEAEIDARVKSLYGVG